MTTLPVLKLFVFIENPCMHLNMHFSVLFNGNNIL